jgi:hypothetical protein
MISSFYYLYRAQGSHKCYILLRKLPESSKTNMSKLNLSRISIQILPKMKYNMNWPGLGVSLSMSILLIALLLSGTILGMKNVEAQIPAADDYSIESYFNSGLQVQCIHEPVWPQANQPITISAKAVNGSLAPKVAGSIEIVINSNRTEPVIPPKNITSSSTLNYTIGPFKNLTTTVSYGCSVIDNGTSELSFTGMKKIVIGAFNESSTAIPVLYTGNRSSNMDILFVPDNKTFSSPMDPNFLIDVQRAIALYYNQSIFLKNQNKTNFWIAQDMGEARNNCESIPPANWNIAYLSFDAAVILHRDDSMRDCTRNDKELSTANMATLEKEGYVFVHEIGHRPFGLADEYDYGGLYESSAPWRNVFNGEQACTTDELTLKMGKTCRKIPYEYGLNKYFTSDSQPDDMMVDNGQLNDLDNRRIEKWFEDCLSPSDNTSASPARCTRER